MCARQFLGRIGDPFKCEQCGKQGFRKRTWQRFCSKQCNARHQNENGINRTYDCKMCGCKFRPKAGNRKTFCSRECAFAHKSADAESRRQSRAVADGCLLWCNKWCPCAACGKMFVGRRNSKYCSEECRPPSYATVEVIVAPCVDCGKKVRRTAGLTKPPRCKRCSRRRCRSRLNKNHRRRALKYGVPYDSSVKAKQVFDLDGYVCQVCGKKTMKDKKVPHPKAPTIDHIIPMSKGGGHVWGNVQCACFMCNSVKSSNASVANQMRLAI